MRNFIYMVVLFNLCCFSFADNLQHPIGLKCKGTLINMNTPENVIETNCKAEKVKNSVQVANGQNALKVKDFTTNDGITDTDIDLSKIKFTADDGSRHICYYKNNKLVKCKEIKAAASAAK